jgi:type VI secretion system secreted protein Hcp
MKRTLLVVFVALAIIATAGVTWAMADTTGGGNVISACVANRTGAVRVVPASESCRRAEHPLSWNQIGPQGLQGEPGPAGPAGASPGFCSQLPAVQTTGGGSAAYLNVDGIPGDTTAQGHENQIEVLSWQWGVGDDQALCSAAARNIPFHDLVVTKRVDKASPLLFKAVATGQHIPQVVLSLSKTSSGKPFDYLVITMNDVLVTSAKPGFGGGDQLPNESITLNFTKVEFKYVQQNPDGTVGTPIAFCFDAVSHQAC